MKKGLYGVVLAVLIAPIVQAREWTDSTGQFRAEAEFVSLANGIVQLRMPSGKTRVCSLERLSRLDQVYIQQQSRGGDNAIDLQSAARAEDKGAEAGVSAMTLSFRHEMAPLNTAVSKVPTPAQALTNNSVYRLTGWHCDSGWYCCHTVHCCPIHPCPKPVDVGKRIYKGSRTTFHLVNAGAQTKPPQTGTVAFHTYDHHGCCHKYLAFLKLIPPPPPVGIPYPPLIYQSVPATGGVLFWLIMPAAPGSCCHQIYWSNGTNPWQWFDCDCEEIPE